MFFCCQGSKCKHFLGIIPTHGSGPSSCSKMTVAVVRHTFFLSFFYSSVAGLQGIHVCVCAATTMWTLNGWLPVTSPGGDGFLRWETIHRVVMQPKQGLSAAVSRCQPLSAAGTCQPLQDSPCPEKKRLMHSARRTP